MTKEELERYLDSLPISLRESILVLSVGLVLDDEVAQELLRLVSDDKTEIRHLVRQIKNTSLFWDSGADGWYGSEDLRRPLNEILRERMPDNLPLAYRLLMDHQEVCKGADDPRLTVPLGRYKLRRSSLHHAYYRTMLGEIDGAVEELKQLFNWIYPHEQDGLKGAAKYLAQDFEGQVGDRWRSVLS